MDAVMNDVLNWLETIFEQIPLQLLEVWGRFGYLLGLILMVCAFGGFTFRQGSRWRFGREVQTWDTEALHAMIVTLVLIVSMGYIGSFIVLVPGAQTFESLKDLSVFLCIVLFGYPALLMVPFAYGISDLIEGVPPTFLWDWIIGYFANPACFWVAYQFIGKDPNFRRKHTWLWYLIFVVIFMSLEPQMWGYICAGQFTSEVSYRNITPALFLTTTITWILAPFAMLVALPLARKFGLFWAEIPGHVKERNIGLKTWNWESGRGEVHTGTGFYPTGLPIRLFLVAPFIFLVLVMVAATAYVTLSSSENTANKLASRLHQEIANNVNLQLDNYLENSSQKSEATQIHEINILLQQQQISSSGRVFIINRQGDVVASSGPKDLVIESTIQNLILSRGSLQKLNFDVQFQFNVVTAKPLAREIWLAQATMYEDKGGGHRNWILMTAMPSTYYLESIRIGNSLSAMISAIALLMSLVFAAFLAGMVTAPVSRISRVTQALAQGDLAQRVPSSRLEELRSLSFSFNNMAFQLQETFDQLRREVEIRKHREHELEESEERLRTSEKRLQLATNAANLGIWDWDVVNKVLIWDETMYQQYGISKENFKDIVSAWSKMMIPEDIEKVNLDVQLALRGERDFNTEFRIRWADESLHCIRAIAQIIRDEKDIPVRMVGISVDITKQKNAEQELMQHRNHLAELVAERTAALSIAVAQAEAAIRAKDEQVIELEQAKEKLVTQTVQLEASNRELESFSYSVSHDLRAPLRGIDGWSMALIEDYGHTLDEKALKFLERVRTETQRMGNLIDDLLKLSQISRIEMKKERVNLSHLAEEITNRLEEAFPQRQISVRIQPNLFVEGDIRLLEILLTNLFSNAYKFTGKTAQALIEFGQKEIDGHKTFFIRDNGAGFNMNFAKNLFGAFQRMHKQSDFPGTGVGLATVQRIIHRHRGRVWAEAAVQQGATFYFTINGQNFRK